MLEAEFTNTLKTVDQRFSDIIDKMDPLAVSLLRRPTFFLSRLLLGVICYGSTKLDDKAVFACQSVELLDQALRIANNPIIEATLNEDNLLITDYLYAQAIDSAINIGRPVVINILAKVIMNSAQAKLPMINGEKRSYLRSSAFKIGIILGELQKDEIDRLRSAQRAAYEDETFSWITLMPDGFVKQNLEESYFSK